ncbi:hypothetical protein EN885_02415 [Mesorhizobium sp. M6A.T.Cr.TU.014.01.1.1]|uniref:hypothetical protein n=1 Tax=Mesorhizobium sp. M6A.T.Cr.TU.014.01.1.1 TaxID=2496676 RepID=UPI000FD2EA64|nr:hypothetical protein [Mesorhizobium sp. M6A.T.Cr.TU.014.01.1.1]RVB79761.1 hypothetical protein EN885_02415 [Mesorhizobium sp. M6A.T.Cr.TU.014.01.1.1]
MARSAKTEEGCWKKLGADAKLEHPSSDRASLGHLLPQGEKEEMRLITTLNGFRLDLATGPIMLRFSAASFLSYTRS